MSTPKERPILMCADMVRAVLRTDNPKTQTRRVLKPQPWCNRVGQWLWERRKGESLPFHPGLNETHYPGTKLQHVCPHGKPGDRLWVRETFQFIQANSDGQRGMFSSAVPFTQHDYRWIEYAATPRDEEPPKWKPSIFMPRWASRITLEIVSVRVERVQDITEEDAKAEGIDGRFHPKDPKLWTWRDYSTPERYAYGSMFGPKESFHGLWDSINGKRPGCAWKDSPWVWVITFRRLP